MSYIVFEGPEEERNMNTLVEMINSMEVREDDETFKNAVDYMFDGLERRSPQHFAVRQYKKYKLASGKTAKSILISCGARLAPFDIPQLREIMSYDELELDKLGDEKSALFFLISDTDTTYNFLVALAFSQMFNLLCERADNTYGGRLPYHVRVLWDEAANTGQVPGLEKIVAVIRSREISLTLFYQAMSQCKALYKDHSETIMGNIKMYSFLTQNFWNWNRTSPASGSITLTGFPAISLPPGSSTTAMQPPFTSGRRRTLPKARLPRNRAYPIIHARRARAYEKRD